METIQLFNLILFFGIFFFIGRTWEKSRNANKSIDQLIELGQLKRENAKLKAEISELYQSLSDLHEQASTLSIDNVLPEELEPKA